MAKRKKGKKTNKKSLKIPNGYSEALTRRRIDNTMANENRKQ